MGYDYRMSTELSSVADLRDVYRQPNRAPLEKVIHQLDDHCVNFLAQSPFFVLSTSDGNGVCDGSPKGGAPGFVEALDPNHVAWADFSGNNRLDSFQNIVDNPSVALLFMIPGLDETLRINGRARLTTDEALTNQFKIGDRDAKVVVVVEVAEAYIHCAKALRRSELWDTNSWASPDELPSAPQILKDHVGLDAPTDVIAAASQADLEATLWQPGGQRPNPQ